MAQWEAQPAGSLGKRLPSCCDHTPNTAPRSQHSLSSPWSWHPPLLCLSVCPALRSSWHLGAVAGIKWGQQVSSDPCPDPCPGNQAGISFPFPDKILSHREDLDFSMTWEVQGSCCACEPFMLPHLCLMFVQPPVLLDLAPTSPAGRATGIGGPGMGLQLPEVPHGIESAAGEGSKAPGVPWQTQVPSSSPHS